MEEAKDPTPKPRLVSTRRRYAAISVGSLIVLSLALIVSGVIKPNDRLNAAEILLLVLAGLLIAFLLTPNFLERVTKLKFSDFEIELDRIQRDQQQQQKDLDGVRFVLSLLLKNEELAHLRNLKSGNVRDYMGNASVRAELGKLLDLRLIERMPGRGLRQIRDNVQFTLSDIVHITPQGESFLKRSAELSPEKI
jgi:hypothetical protein